jgi:hypothetical protein
LSKPLTTVPSHLLTGQPLLRHCTMSHAYDTSCSLFCASPLIAKLYSFSNTQNRGPRGPIHASTTRSLSVARMTVTHSMPASKMLHRRLQQHAESRPSRPDTCEYDLRSFRSANDGDAIKLCDTMAAARLAADRASTPVWPPQVRHGLYDNARARANEAVAASHNMVCRRLSNLIVNNFDETMTLVDEGNKACTVAATNVNETYVQGTAFLPVPEQTARHASSRIAWHRIKA